MCGSSSSRGWCFMKLLWHKEFADNKEERGGTSCAFQTPISCERNKNEDNVNKEESE
jgi:hypothetical protein